MEGSFRFFVEECDNLQVGAVQASCIRPTCEA